MNVAIVLSGGTGTRLGAHIPKQYIEVNNRPIISYSLETIIGHRLIDHIIIVAAEEWQDLIKKCVTNADKDISFCQPGNSRQGSILNGLKKCEKLFNNDVDLVLIHDAARPLLSEELIERCLNISDEYDGAMPVLSVKDTTYQSIDGTHITALLDRNTLFAGQAPESFRFRKYLDIHNPLSSEEIDQIKGSSEIAHKFGLNIKLVKGDPLNFKITDNSDLNRFKTICNESYCTSRD